MSNNTNTLFWVITGAVIIFSIYLLTNTGTNTLSNINNQYNNMFDVESTKTTTTQKTKTQEEIDLEEYNKKSTRTYCRQAVSKDSSLSVKMTYATEYSVAYTITNISKNDLIKPWVMLRLYDCNNNNQIKSCALFLDSFNVGQTGTYICNGGVLPDVPYYATIHTEYY